MIRKEFKELIEKYLSGKATPEEERLIDDFFNTEQKKQSKEHLDIVSEEMWVSLSRRIHGSAGRSPVGGDEKKSRHFSSVAKIGLTLSLILILAFVGLAAYFNGAFTLEAPVSWVRSEAAKGQKSLITLADGSKVYLNSGSSITYPEIFKKDKREIILLGEAFFEVTRDEQRPFTVRTSNVVARVLGTSFNVEAFDGQDIKVTVLTGKVQVQVSDGRSTIDADQLILEPNEQAVYDGQSRLTRETVDVDKFVAWKSNGLYFDDNTLDEVAIALERWYNVAITFQHDDIKLCRINGQYRDMDLQSVLKSIQYMYQVNYKYLDQNTIELYGKGCK